jgi:hypothetical protein
MKKILTAFLIAGTIAGCGPATVIDKSWRDPATTITPGYFKKVLVAALVRDDATRRMIEDNIAKRSPNTVPSYTVFEKGDANMDEAAAEAKLRNAGFDGAIIIRYISVEKETSYVPGSGVYPSFYGGFGPYWRISYGAFYQPGYYVEDKIHTVETNVYDLKNNKLVWSGVTSSTNPGKGDKMINEIADVIGKQMRAEGFLVK